MDGDYLTCTDLITHRIPTLPNVPAVNTRPYRLPEANRKEVDRQVQEMLEQGIVQPSNSSWNSPLLLVPKKPDAEGNKKWRVVVDFRKVNEITIGDSYPLPNITDILDQLGHSQYFSTLDLASGYHQIPMDPMDRHKTAFTTPYGFFEYTRMPFGLKSAGSSFQRLMNAVLTGLQGIKCFVYLDDIVIYGKSLSDHNQKLCEVFDRLREANLKLQPEKCHFLNKEIIYLGHIVGTDGIRPDPGKFDAVKNFSPPKTPRQIKSFLGLTGYYRRFIKDYAGIAKPLTRLLKKDVKFIWNPFCDEAFNILKNKLTTAPVLIYPKFDEEFLLTTDASGTAIGGILSQGKLGEDQPVCYASKTLSETEIKYSTIERECFAIIYMTKHFRPYLYGRKFTIVTDHKPLIWLMNAKDQNSRLMRWKLKLEDYDYTIVHRAGTRHANADALSRVNTISVVTRSKARLQRDLVDSSDEISENDPKYLEKEDIETISEHLEPVEPFSQSKPLGIDENLTYLLPDTTKDPSENFVLPNPEGSDPNDGDDPYELEYFIQENYQTKIKTKFFDQTYYLYAEESINMKQNLKSNQIFLDSLDALTYDNLIKLSENEKIARISPHLRTSSDVDVTKTVAFHIYHDCITNKFSNIAISLEINDPKSYFEIKMIFTNFFCETNIPITFYLNRVVEVIDPDERKRILREFHGRSHPGISRMKEALKLQFSWDGIAKSIEDLVRTCPTCQKVKVTKRNKLPMKITSTSMKPFEKIFIDIVGPLPVSYANNRYILTIQDDLTKYSLGIPLPNQEASTVARALVERFICIFGIPDSILSDQGSNFLSKLFIEVTKLLKIHKLTTTAYHPQTNGSLERSHRTLAEYLRQFVIKDALEWDMWLPYAFLAYNTSVHASTRYTPYQLLFGFLANIPINLKGQPGVCYNYDNYANEIRSRLQNSYQLARKNILQSKEKSKKYYDKGSREVNFQVGDLVLIRNETATNKFSPIWLGPYQVEKINSAENTTVKVGVHPKIIHNNRLRLYHEDSDD